MHDPTIDPPVRRGALRPASEAVLVVLALGTVWGVLCLATVQGEVAGLNWDDALYLLMADGYRGALAADPAVYRAVFGWRDYPPVFPLFLALSGAGSAHLARAFVCNAFAICLSVGAVYCYARVTLRDRAIAALVAICMLGCAQTLRLAYGLWSENLCLAFVLAALATARSQAANRALGAAMLFALAACTRSATIVWCLAFAAWLCVERPPRYRPAAVLAVALPLVERLLHGHAQYGKQWGATFADTAWLGRLGEAAATLATGFGDTFSVLPPLSRALAVVVGAAAVSGWMRRREWLELSMTLVYLAQMSVWGYPAQAARFMYVLVPLALVAAGRGLRDAAAAPDGSARPRGLVAGAIVALLVAVPNLASLGRHWREGAADDEPALRRLEVHAFGTDRRRAAGAARFHLQIARDARSLPRWVAPHDCVLSELPALVLLHAHRDSDLPPWREWAQARPGVRIACRYYYALPAYLTHADPAPLLALGATLIFQSQGHDPEAPGVPSGMLFDLLPQGGARR